MKGISRQLILPISSPAPTCPPATHSAPTIPFSVPATPSPLNYYTTPPTYSQYPTMFPVLPTSIRLLVQCPFHHPMDIIYPPPSMSSPHGQPSQVYIHPYQSKTTTQTPTCCNQFRFLSPTLDISPGTPPQTHTLSMSILFSTQRHLFVVG